MVCISKLIHMFTHFGFARQKRFKKCPSLTKLLPRYDDHHIYDNMRVLGWDEEEDEDANVQKSNGEKTRNMCGTNKEIQLGNMSVIERDAYGMQKSERPSPPLFAVSNNSKDRWVTAAIIINTNIITTMCYQHKKGKCSNRTHKILITIVHINLVTLIVNLMKIRNSITKKYFSKRKKSLLNT